MSTSLQCPDCGQKHPLGSVGDRAVFPCARCARPLKVPAAYRPGTNGSSGNGGGNGAASPAGSRPAGSRGAPRRRGSASLGLPVRILLWVVAFGLGAVVVRMIAKWTGFVGGDTLVDLLIDHSFGNYFKLFVLVPFWALFSTLFLTLFLEGPDWYRRRRAGVPMGPASPRTPATAGAASAGVAQAAAKAGTRAGAKAAGATARAGTAGTIPKRVPAAAGAAAAGAAVGAATRPRAIPRRGDPRVEPEPTAPAPRPRPDDRTQALAVAPVGAAESEPVDEYAERAAAGHRPRRIPRRDVGS